jgi:hypothetical protein
LNEAVVSIAVGSLVRIPVQSYVGTNVRIYVDQDDLAKRSSRLYALLSKEFAIAPPCMEFDNGNKFEIFLKYSTSA